MKRKPKPPPKVRLICPFTRQNDGSSDDALNTPSFPTHCHKEKCALWVMGLMSVEDNPQPGMCAFAVIASKGRGGKIMV